MKILHLAALTVLAAFTGLASAHAQQLTQATVTALSGDATVILPGSSQAVAITAGMKLPEGATISTGDNSEVLIQTHAGIEAGFPSNTVVSLTTMDVDTKGVRNVLLDLQSGTVVSNLDPSKRDINNYGVRTTKGVAAARGTTYSTTVAGARVVVNTVTGSVSFFVQNSEGVEVEIAVGGGEVSSGSTAVSLTDALNDPSIDQAALAQAVTGTVTVAAIIVQASPAGSSEAAAANAVLATVVQQVTTATVATGNTALLNQAVSNAASIAPASVATMTAAVSAAAGANSAVAASANNAANTGAANPRATVTTTTNDQGQTTITTEPTTAEPSEGDGPTTETPDVPVIDPGVIVTSPSA